MSFLHNLYSKVIPDHGSRRTNSYDVRSHKNETPVFEDFESEDGFVVYSEKTSTVGCAYGIHERLQYNTMETSAGPRNCTSPGFSPSGSSESNLSRGPKEQPSSTFLTVSDVPFKLSKSLEMLHNSNKGSLLHSPRRFNIEEYLYDFSLERTVISSNDDNTKENRW